MGKRIVSRRRGAGSIFRAPSHKYVAEARYPNIEEGSGIVKDILHDPGRTAPLAEIILEGTRIFLPAAEGLKSTQTINLGEKALPALGNILPLGRIPEGTKVFNLEAQPGDGGKYVRSAGTRGIVITQGAKTIVQMPSGKMKAFNPQCRATIGVAGGGGRIERPWFKAGKKYLALRAKAQYYPRVSGVAMNPVAHPYGGGGHQHVGKHGSVSRDTPPGRKVGKIAPKRTGRRKL
ncbi:MAG: 50S ribosomal protein L2 [Candidatus Thermoplasmatota archaeon]|nr:50S ribosomal protein L2 [Candidatus Thermoplasmatota archaeon]